MRSVYDIAKELATYAPNGGATWQNVGMRQVPVRLLTELREAVEREQRVKVAWRERPLGEPTGDLEPDYDALPPPLGRRIAATYAGAWKFDG